VTADKLTIRNIRARAVMPPFKRPPVSASGALPHAALILIDLETEQGLTGRSYLFGFAAWTLKPIIGCVEAMRDLMVRAKLYVEGSGATATAARLKPIRSRSISPHRRRSLSA